MKFEVKVLSIFIVVSLFLFSGSIFLRNRVEHNKKSEEGISQVKGTTDFSTYPAIANIAPNTAVVDDLYRYDLVIVDSDSVMNNINIELLESPNWLKVDGLSILGIPKANNLGSNKVVIKVSDEKQSIFSTFYIFVTTGDESN